MKKRKNLIKTLALCGAIGLGVGYAVVGNQELTYTESIPVGERKLNVVINDPRATNNGTTLAIEQTIDYMSLVDQDGFGDVTYISIPLINNERDYTAEVSAEIKFYADDVEVDIGPNHHAWGFKDVLGEEYFLLPPGAEGTFIYEYVLNDYATLQVESHETFRIVILITAIPVID